MRKIFGFLIAGILAFSIIFAVPVKAEGGVVLAMESKTAKQGDTIDVAVKVTSNSGFAFLMVTPSYDKDNLELVGTVNGGVCGSMTNGLNPNWNGNGQNVTATGTLVTFQFKVNGNAAVKKYEIGVIVRQCYSAASENVEVTAPMGVLTVGCSTHSYSAWSKVDGNSHKHTCSVCGSAETASHTWDSGKITQTASCKDTGIKTYTCTGCGDTKTETIAKTDSHSYGSWTSTKEATCTAAGQQTRTCSVCGKTETKTVAALGHSFSKATVTKEATCTETGVETGKCTRCGQTTTNAIKAKGHKFGSWAEKTAATCTAGGTEERKCPACSSVETRSTEALGHDFENPVIVREATISATGLMEGKCRRCSEATQQVIPCTATDAGTGTVFEAEEGVFADGTSIEVVEVADGAGHTSAQTALADVTNTFQLVDISALVDGAEVQPNGKVKVTFAKPEDFGSNVGLYHISTDAVATRLEAAVSDDGSTITVEVDSFGAFAICDLDGGTAEPDGIGDDGAVSAEPDGEKQKTDGSGSPVLWIVLGLAAVLAAAGVILYFAKKKHRR